MYRALFLLCAVRTTFGVIEKEFLPSIKNTWFNIDSTADFKVPLLDGWMSGPCGLAESQYDPPLPYFDYGMFFDQESYFKGSYPQSDDAPEDKPHPEYTVQPPRTQHSIQAGYIQIIESKTSRRNKYFTPANEISLKKVPIKGLYFEPNKTK